ncbi:MAG: ATP-binding cassette domain-containing protein [Clostridia bacterium]
MNTIETTHLKKCYGKKVVVDDVSFTLREGDIYGLIGKNGAGKTTLIRMILGLAAPTSGEISLNGASSPEGLRTERKKIGAIVDQPSYEPHLTAYQNMKAASLSFGLFDDEKVRHILHVVGLNADDKKPARNFSLGMKQRLAIGLAFIGDPRILILDEPVNGLDPEGIFEVREILLRINKEFGVTILISSHMLAELSKLATCFGIMDKGKLIKELRGGDLEELCRPFIKVVVGDLKGALNVVVDNFHSADFEILPFNTLAFYDMSKGVAGIASMFSSANIPVVSISQSVGDLETTFLTLLGGNTNEQ